MLVEELLAIAIADPLRWDIQTLQTLNRSHAWRSPDRASLGRRVYRTILNEGQASWRRVEDSDSDHRTIARGVEWDSCFAALEPRTVPRQMASERDAIAPPLRGKLRSEKRDELNPSEGLCRDMRSGEKV